MSRPKKAIQPSQVAKIKQYVSTAGHGGMSKAAKEFGLSYFIIRGIVGKVSRKKVARKEPRKRGRPALSSKVKKQTTALRQSFKAFQKLSKSFEKLNKAVQVLKG